jgi:hypothetical protein
MKKFKRLKFKIIKVQNAKLSIRVKVIGEKLLNQNHKGRINEQTRLGRISICQQLHFLPLILSLVTGLNAQ